jgi:hypothetical protein
MKEGTETALYNQGYMDGFDDAQKAYIEPIKPKLKDVKEKSFPKDEPDYWDKLTHQAAISAMHGIMSNPVGFESIRCSTEDCDKKVAEIAICFAEELVKGLKLIRSN